MVRRLDILRAIGSTRVSSRVFTGFADKVIQHVGGDPVERLEYHQPCINRAGILVASFEN